MKRNTLADHTGIVIILIPIIIGEILFNKIYIDPVEIITFHNLSIPIYGVTFAFFLKFLIFDPLLWGASIHLFITKKYYGFPYPEFLCPFFAIITILNIILVICNFFYFLFNLGNINQIYIYIQKLTVLFTMNPVTVILQILSSIDYSVFFPIIPFVLLCITGNTIETFQNSTNQNFKYELWEKHIVLPGETEYKNEEHFRIKFESVLISYIVIYRTFVLMNIRLSSFKIIGILSILLVIFFFIEYNSYNKQLTKDRAFIYQKLSSHATIGDSLHWKDLLEFQILENQSLNIIEKKYKNSQIRNIRWLELYEHIIINDTKSMYDTIANLEEGIYDITTAINEIKSRISSIEKISLECIPILPNSRIFHPENIELLSYFTKKIPLMNGQFKYNKEIKSYNSWVNVSDLDSILLITQNYLSTYTNGEFICESSIDPAGWLNIRFITQIHDTKSLPIIKNHIKQLSQFWDASKPIDHYNFPINLAILQSYMKDINGEMLMLLNKNELHITLTFPNVDLFPKDTALKVKNVSIDISKFLKKYTLRKENYTYIPSTEKIVLQTDVDLLKEILDIFTRYSIYRIKDDSTISISVQKGKNKVSISLKFLCHFYFYPIEKEIEETLHYWRTRENLVLSYSSLHLLLIKNKMEQLSGFVSLSLKDDYFHCKLIFNSNNDRNNHNVND